jgi:hypothetical protein
MRNYLDNLCGKHPDGVMVAIQFNSGAMVQGALRKAKSDGFDAEGLFELMGPGQISDPQNPKIPKNVMVSNFFEPTSVERVLLFHDLPQPTIVTPNHGGIIVPS